MCQVKRHDHTISILEEAIGQLAEALLSCCIPDLDSARCPIFRRVLHNREVDPRCGHLLRIKLLLAVSLQDRCLPDTTVTNQKQIQRIFDTSGNVILVFHVKRLMSGTLLLLACDV